MRRSQSRSQAMPQPEEPIFVTSMNANGEMSSIPYSIFFQKRVYSRANLFRRFPLNRLSLIALLVFSFLSFPGYAGPGADGKWIEENFFSVFKSSPRMGSAKGKLLLELGLLNEGHKTELTKVLRKRLLNDKFVLTDLLLEEKAVAERALAGLRYLAEHKLVLVERHSINTYEVEGQENGEYYMRTGVMSAMDYEKLYGKEPLKNLGFVKERAAYLLNGEKTLIDESYVDLFEYLEFSNRYHGSLRMIDGRV